ncbi:MAG: hypothetical protein ACKVU4_03425 [Phycisphaerales bacterium]
MGDDSDAARGGGFDVNNILAWIKGHVPIVVLSAVILVSLPTAFAFSSMWNRSIRTAREKEVTDALRSVSGTSVNYVVPPNQPGEAPVELNAPAPNETITKWFREKRAERDGHVKATVDQATALNKAGHEVLVQGLFPMPTEQDAMFKRLEFIELLVGKGGGPSVYQRLLDEARAGAPADAVRVLEEITELELREIDRIRAEHGEGAITPERVAEITEKLTAQRIARYQQRAGEVSVYATMDCLPRDPDLPRRLPSEPPKVWECFELQWDYWVTQDLLRAVAAANTDADGHATTVDQSVVKRIEKVRVDRLPIIGESAVSAETWTPTAGLGSDKAPLDPQRSITWRRSSKTNALYDVRCADLEVVADSSRLIDLVNAISRTNFMTVIGCDLAEVDAHKDLRQGYYYGSAHVVKATLRVETVWLRSWLKPLMPDGIRDGLAIPPDPVVPPGGG